MAEMAFFFKKKYEIAEEPDHFIFAITILELLEWDVKRLQDERAYSVRLSCSLLHTAFSSMNLPKI